VLGALAFSREGPSTSGDRPYDHGPHAEYNRAHLLGRVYDSLRAQTFPRFEWIIVDDGSQDDTETLVKSWIDKGALEILYSQQAKIGKLAAVNRGVELARGEFTICPTRSARAGEGGAVDGSLGLIAPLGTLLYIRDRRRFER
jgi:hypothetical protein